MVDIDGYKQFMGIDKFPTFSVGYFIPNVSQELFCVARAEYDPDTKAHKLLLPKGYEIARFMLFHELTHILDAEEYSIGDKNYDFCLNGFMEYHASQIELMVMMGAETVSSTVSFSMKDLINGFEWPVEQYINNKLETARTLIIDSDYHKRVDGLGAFYNFLGLKSVCCMFAEDYNDHYDYREFLNIIPSYLFTTMRYFMTGWQIDVQKAVGLYSNALSAVGGS